MRRCFESLRPADTSPIHSVPDGIFLVRVDRAQYRWHRQKPYYEIRFAVLNPKHLTGCLITGRLYCTPKAMWKDLPKTGQCKSQMHSPAKKFCSPCEVVQASAKSGVGSSGFGEGPLGE